MATTTCPECGTLLLPGDEGHCPICRRTVLTQGDEWGAPESVHEEDLVRVEQGPEHETPDHERFGPVEEAFFQQVCARVRQPDAQSLGRPTVIGLMILFVIALRDRQNPLLSAVMLFGAIAFHELGHWTALLLFNYRDPKIFYFPLMNNWLPSRREWAPQWQRAITLLLGPLPGVILGYVLLICWRRLGLDAWTAMHLGMWLIFLNGFYLLPMEPLDGGRFLNIVLFSRQRAIEALFVAGTSLLLLIWSIGRHQYFIAIAALFGLLMVPARYKVAGAAAAIRRRWDALPARIEKADDSLLRDLFRQVRYLGQGPEPSRIAIYANAMRQVHERAIVRPAPILASIGLLLIYTLALLASLVVVRRFF